MSLRDNVEAIAVEGDASDQPISFLENDSVVQKLFEDAIEVLRLVGADESAQYSRQQSHGAQYLWKRRREENQIHHENETSTNKKPEMTKSKRRKLEKIKAPVTILGKPQQEKVSTDEEQEIAVKRMLHYIGQMPSQEVFQPPPVPFVSLPTNVVSNIKRKGIVLAIHKVLQKVSRTALTCQMKKMFLYGRCWSPVPPSAMFLLED